MTPQEQWKEQSPKRREVSFVEKVSWAAIGALLAGTAFYFYTKSATRGEDDERPPLIVRNGSAHFEVAHPGSDGNKGKLDKVNNQRVWHHTHGAGGPQNFRVVVSGVNTTLGGNCSATPHFYAQRVKTVTITYTRTNLTDRKVDIAVGNGHLQITGDPEVEYSQGQDYLLDLDSTANAALKSVTMAFKKNPNDANDTSMTCTFGGPIAPEVMVMQKK